MQFLRFGRIDCNLRMTINLGTKGRAWKCFLFFTESTHLEKVSLHRTSSTMDVRWACILEGIYLFAMQVVLVIILFNAKAVIHPPNCPLKNFTTHRDPPPHAAHTASSLWYYEHEFDFPLAKLRVLTDEDGASPLRSKIPPREREITIVTGTTRDRLGAVEQTAMTWGGAFCLAVHVIEEADIEGLYQELRQLHARVEAKGRCRLDIQLVKEDGLKELIEDLYPVNGMRNIAWRMATTKLIFLLDADFRPNLGMHESLTSHESAYQDMVKKAIEDRHVFVVPAFELVDASDRSRSTGDSNARTVDFQFPQTKEELRRGWANYTFDCFHCSASPASHEPTDLGKYFDPRTTSAYSVPYLERFEPYLIVARETAPMYDERFRGYGKNKISQVYDCVHGYHMQLQVLPQAFILEIPHPPSHSRKAWNYSFHKEQALQMLGLYSRFKSEVQLRRMTWF